MDYLNDYWFSDLVDYTLVPIIFPHCTGTLIGGIVVFI